MFFLSPLSSSALLLVLSPIRLRKCLLGHAWHGHLRKLWQHGAISNCIPLIKQWEKARKVTVRWEIGKNMCWSWWVFDSGMRNSNKKVDAHQKNTRWVEERTQRRKERKKDTIIERKIWQDAYLNSCILKLSTFHSNILWHHFVDICCELTSLNMWYAKKLSFFF